MRHEYLHSWTLKFKDVNQEAKYCQLREDMFRSNMLCVFIVWIFIVLCQAIILPRCTVLVICLAISTVLLTAGCILVMAEEFSGLPIILQKSSATLVHHRNRRTLFICSVIILMSAASSIGLFLCPMIPPSNQLSDDNDTRAAALLSPLPTPAMQTSASTTDQSKQSYDTEIHLNVLIQAIIHHNSTKKAPPNAVGAKEHQFSAQYLNSIQNKIFDKILNKTSEKLLNGTDSASKNQSVSDYAPPNYLYLRQLNHSMTVNSIDNLLVSTTIISSDLPPKISKCSHPEYLVFTWVLCLIALATGLKLYYLVKTFMATIMVCCYALLILVLFPEVFSGTTTDEFDTIGPDIPLEAQMNILLIVFLIMVTYHARLVEVTSRLDFIWKEQAEKELTNMKSNRNLNDLLIKVILVFLS